MLGSRLTVLEAINEVARRLNLRQLTATTGNSWAQTMIGHLNDVCSDLADFSTWEELMASATFTLVRVNGTNVLPPFFYIIFTYFLSQCCNVLQDEQIVCRFYIPDIHFLITYSIDCC